MHFNAVQLKKGDRFNYLTVLREDGRTKGRQIKWLCRCDCGNLTSVASAKLRGGTTKTCGCRLWWVKKKTKDMKKYSREKSRERRARDGEKVRAYQRDHNRNRRKGLVSAYIAERLRVSLSGKYIRGIKLEDIPADLIEAKRLQIQIQRELKK